MKILIIGGGNMGLTYAQSFLRSHIVDSNEMMILEKSPDKAKQLAEMGIGTVYGEPEYCLEEATVIILAVKPQDTEALFKKLRPLTNPSQVFLSIMAGVKLETMKKGLGATKIIRAMPNLPAQIGMGMTTFTATEEVDRKELVMVQNLINTTGKSIYVNSEDLIDSTTAISGSGPAYVFFFMNAMMKSAQQLGFSESEAELLVWQTFMGSVNLFHKNDLTCQDWIKRVASKGGTTEAALHIFGKEDIEQGVINGILAAYHRAVELGE